jgi:hypothetical protein
LVAPFGCTSHLSGFWLIQSPDNSSYPLRKSNNQENTFSRLVSQSRKRFS